MESKQIGARDVGGAREQIFDFIRRNRNKRVIYFNGWDGFGAAPVLRSMAQELLTIKAKKTPPELCFDMIIYVDCSAWKSIRQMLAPTLETIKVRGCWSLRRLPTVAARETGVKWPAVEMEKDVWDALEWDGVAAGHHPELFEPPVHSCYYRRRRLLRGTVLR